MYVDLRAPTRSLSLYTPLCLLASCAVLYLLSSNLPFLCLTSNYVYESHREECGANSHFVYYPQTLTFGSAGAISGDSLILRGRPGPQGQSPKERILHLADVSSPRMGNASREDEAWAFEAREFLRAFVVGKEITFTSAHQLPLSDDVPRDLGNGEVNGLDIATELLKNGWAKVKDLKRDPTEEDNKRKDIENEARSAGRGIWNPHGPKAHQVIHTMPLDSQAYISEWKGKNLDAIVEAVRDGTTLRVRLLMPDGEHQFVNIALAGAKFFVESRLLQRAVKVQLLSLPTAAATPFQFGANGGAPPPASIFIGNVLHPAGNIAEHLVAAGLARIVDWHAGMLASSGGMERLRAAEKVAKEKRLCLYANVPASSASSKAAPATNGHSRSFDATVLRVWTGDQISVADRDSGKERRVQLSSTRAPRISDPKQAYYAQEAREFLRKKLISKHVKVHIDFIRPREGDFEERECATIRYGNNNVNIAEQLIEKGFASVVRHKRDDEDRSPDYDKLMAAEQNAVAETRGMHSGKEQPTPKQPLNLSEAANRASQFVSGFKRQGRIPGVVEYVASGSRFKILLPKDNQVLTLVLGGIRSPRTARNPSEKSEPYGAEAAEFATRRYMQRDVEIEIDTVDKSGGFIGALYLNKTENAAITLVKEGLASVHSFSADSLPWSRHLYEAEEEAKKEKRGLWTDYDEEAEKAANQPADEDSTALAPQYLDVIVSDVRTKNGFSFSVQILNTEGIASLEQLMRDFSIHHRVAPSAPGFVPKGGDLVSAKFSDGSWYRAKIRRASPVKREAEVTFIDYGNQDTIGFENIRPLDPKFRSLPGQARDARLRIAFPVSFIKLVGPESDYHQEAVDRFRQMCEGRKLIANIDQKEGSLLHLRLIDSADPAVVKKLQDAVDGAKRDRLGMFEFGDVEEDE
ncbi:hypothetical protein EW146_g211 [Bondarzewia mesenterica]|uniref:Transcription factor n=1 Tax=Bondarzewia mesenterica TaxID=1095465 RepID=A0A4S4M9L6_9AGAM|nr:hypothetical protein EW146_g211 [Bondarzewia mesenterica]